VPREYLNRVPYTFTREYPVHCPGLARRAQRRARARLRRGSSIGLRALWDVLRAEGIAFEPAASGARLFPAHALECAATPRKPGAAPPSASAGGAVFPLVHLPGAFGIFIAVVPTTDECMRLKQRFLELRL
jgi:hypothetical protein